MIATTYYLFSSDSISQAIEMANHDLTMIAAWFTSNKLSLNISKTQVIPCTESNMNLLDLPPVLILNETLAIVSRSKLLGMEIDSEPTRTYHINNIRRRMSAFNAVIQKLHYTLGYGWLMRLYKSQFVPYMTYCYSVCGSTYKQHRN